jgi:hypothetical protein
MRASKMLCTSVLIAACVPVVARAQTVVFSEGFDGGTGVGRFDSYLSQGDGSFNASYDYGAFKYKLFPDYENNPSLFTEQFIPPAPGGTSTTGMRVSVNDTSGLIANMQLLPKAVGGGNVTVGDNFKIGFDMWINYNGGNGGGTGSTQHMAAGLNVAGTGDTGFAPGSTIQPGYLFTSTGEGGNSGDYRINTNDTGDDGPTYEKVNANWTGVREVNYDHVTGAYLGGDINPDEAQNSYFESLFPTGTAETPGAPGKQWVHVTIEQHGNAVEYSMNGKHVASLFLSNTMSGVPTFGLYDRNTGTAGAEQPDLFMLYDNIAVTQLAPTTKFNASSGTFGNAANWTNGVPSGNGQDAVFDGAPGAATVTVSAPVTLRALRFDSANSYTIGGASTISLTAETNNFVVNAGSHSITAPVAVTGHMSIYNRAGTTLTASNVSTDPTKFFSKTGTGTLAINKIRAAGMTLTAGVVQLLPNGGTSKVGAMHLSDSHPLLDITNNALILDYTLRADTVDPLTNNSPFETILGQVAQGRHNGDWNPTPGDASVITSSAAAAVAADNGNTHKTAIGFGESSALFGASGGIFNGEAVDGDAILIKYTLIGDSNLDGRVNALDFNILASNYGNPLATQWVQGDSNYDQFVDSSDFSALAVNFNSALAGPGLGTLVPEPMIGAAGIALGLFALRRRTAGSKEH